MVVLNGDRDCWLGLLVGIAGWDCWLRLLVGMPAEYSCYRSVVGCGISYTAIWLQSQITATSFMVLGAW